MTVTSFSEQIIKVPLWWQYALRQTICKFTSRHC